MNPNALTYPEQHTTWLTAMGVSRWQTREVSSTAPDVQPSYTWPEAMLRARYWVVGEHLLDDATAHLLAGMMVAIGVASADVAYAAPMDTGLPHVATSLAKLPQIQTFERT
jgi:hypothetical protein